MDAHDAFESTFEVRVRQGTLVLVSQLKSLLSSFIVQTAVTYNAYIRILIIIIFSTDAVSLNSFNARKKGHVNITVKK